MSTIIVSNAPEFVARWCELYGGHALDMAAGRDPGVYMLRSGCVEGFAKAVGTDSGPFGTTNCA